MIRCNSLIDQPRSTNVVASQSNRAGCDGGSLRKPKSLGVRTNPSRKWCIHTRFTITRAVSGLSLATIRRASAKRPLPFPNGASLSDAKNFGNRRATCGPWRLGFPRRNTTGSYGDSASRSTMARGGAPG